MEQLGDGQAGGLGGSGPVLDEGVLKEWSDRLVKLWRVEGDAKVDLRGKHLFAPPLQPQFWEAWRKFSGDPEPCLAKLAKDGAPFGMSSGTTGCSPPPVRMPWRTMCRSWRSWLAELRLFGRQP